MRAISLSIVLAAVIGSETALRVANVAQSETSQSAMATVIFFSFVGWFTCTICGW